MPASLPPPHFIDHQRGFRDLVRRLEAESQIAVDTESNSLFAYFERVCLIQISTPTEDWILDPLHIGDLSPLTPIFASERIEKVFHAAEYDVMCLKRDFGFEFANLFDTMQAARIVGWKSFGLGSLLEQHFGVKPDKRYQRADWSMRPLPHDQIRYAQLDTHFLLRLRAILHQALVEQDCLEEAREAFASVAETLPAPERVLDPDDCWSLPAARSLNRRQIGALRELFTLRDQIARERDLPVFKIIGDEGLVRIVEESPQSEQDLVEIPGVGRHLVQRYGGALIAALNKGLNAPPPRPPRRQRQDGALLVRFDALREWRRDAAEQRGVESDVIIAKEVLWAIARADPTSLEQLAQVPGMGAWKLKRYGTRLLEVLAEVRARAAKT